MNGWSAFLMLALGCESPPPSPAEPDPCDVLLATGGQPGDALALARSHVAAGRTTGDEGEYTLADNAVRCALAREATNHEALLLRAHLLIQQHRFGEAASAAEPLISGPEAWQAWLLLGDARMEQGDLDAAAEAFQHAADLRPGLPVYDRIGWLRWMEGDVVGAREMMVLAVEAGSPTDPEPLAWALSRLGWLKVLAGEPAPEFDAALALVPDYSPALLARGNARLVDGSPAFDREAGLADLRKLPHNVEALRTRAAFEAVEIRREMDPRGWADFIAPTDPAAALAVLDEELKVRHDAVTLMSHAWALHHAHRPGAADEAGIALATGCPEPRVLHHGAIILADPSRATRALSMAAGLTVTERHQLQTVVDTTVE